jgi:hypothetical protein
MKIVSYLLARYGRDSSRESEAPSVGMPLDLPDVEVGPRKQVMPRPGSAFREKLDEIRSSNDGFRESLPEEEPPARFSGIIGALPAILIFYGACLVGLGIGYWWESGALTSDVIAILIGGPFLIILATWFAASRSRR